MAMINVWKGGMAAMAMGWHGSSGATRINVWQGGMAWPVRGDQIIITPPGQGRLQEEATGGDQG
eukprot:437334-Hanusia_phi.AAC.1